MIGTALFVPYYNNIYKAPVRKAAGAKEKPVPCQEDRKFVRVDYSAGCREAMMK